MSDTPTPLTLFLADHDVPCPNPKCGFNLRGLKHATCPECKEPLSLAVHRPEALWNMRKWVVAAVICTIVSYATTVAEWGLAAWNSMAYWFNWEYGLSLTAVIGVVAALILAMCAYVFATRKQNPRALPRLLRSFLIAMCVSGVVYSCLTTYRLVGALLGWTRW